MGITHVLNAADGPQHIDTGPQFYSDLGLKYHGVPAADRRDFDLAPYFSPAADFIHEALRRRGVNTSGHHIQLWECLSFNGHKQNMAYATGSWLATTSYFDLKS